MNIYLAYQDAGTKGMGHVIRSKAFAWACPSVGHTICFGAHLNVAEILVARFLTEPTPVNHQDWIVLDFPGVIPDDVFASTRKVGAKVCLLDGDGEAPWEPLADLVVVQGCPTRTKRGRPRANVLAGAEYVIIRPEIFTVERKPGDEWLIYGGSTDPLGVVPAFMEACKKMPAVLLPADRAHLDKPLPNHRIRHVHGDGILPYFGLCKAACIKFGMVAWELAALGVPVYAFVLNERDMRFAKGMEEAGLIRAYPEVGLPSHEKMRAFLAEPFAPTGTRPDSNGAARILEAMSRG